LGWRIAPTLTLTSLAHRRRLRGGGHCPSLTSRTAAGYGVVGVAPNVTLMNLKVLDAEGNGNTAVQKLAMDYVMLMKAHITSNSYGAEGRVDSQASTLKALEEQGILLVAAAGNERRDNDVYPVYPASFAYKNIISVAASNEGDCM
jgi:subtilisin family serine protease